MDLFKWSNDYSVKNEMLDNEHKKLFKIINDLYTAFINKETKEKLNDILSELHNYTVYHFTHEESILSMKGHPLSDEHLITHKAFIAKIDEFEDKAKQGRNVVQYEMMNFLKNWLIEHIQGTDKNYAQYFN